MRRDGFLRALGIGVAAAVLTAGPALAAGKVELLPTGLTIGGPMAVVVFPPSDNVAIFVDPLNVCVTLINTGKRFVQLGLSEPSPGTSHLWLVDDGRSFTTCAPGIERVTIHCDVEKGCSASVRIDRY
jgi:hypothetical protein